MAVQSLRRAGLLTRAIGSDFVVLDPESGIAHSLGGDAAAVWRGDPLPDDRRAAALAELAAANLVVRSGTPRRRVLQVGAVTAGVGLASLILPSASAAASTTGPGGDGGGTTGSGGPTGLRPYVQIRPVGYPDGQQLDFNDPTPTTFDATGLFASPDPGPFRLSWTAGSSVTVPSDPAFSANINVTTVSVLNADWGFGSSCSVTVTLVPLDGRSQVSASWLFLVGDAP